MKASRGQISEQGKYDGHVEKKLYRAKIWVVTLEKYSRLKSLNRQHKSGQVRSQVQTNQPMQKEKNKCYRSESGVREWILIVLKKRKYQEISDFSA